MNVRRCLLVLLALAFSMSGVARALAAYEHCQAAGQPVLVEHEHAHHSHAGHGATDEALAPVQHDDHVHGKSAEPCAKCCGVCVSAPTVAVSAPSAAAILASSAILYSAGAPAYLGRIVLLDPGIPKRS